MTLAPRLLDERTFTGACCAWRGSTGARSIAPWPSMTCRTPSALPVLHIARSGGGMRQGHLAEELGVEGPSLVRILDQLCAAGLVERRDDPKDGRPRPCT
jgi:MarR family transcriptional regulator for hemolysin